eukprot:3331438-Pyramimonas_sp.AAC.2
MKGQLGRRGPVRRPRHDAARKVDRLAEPPTPPQIARVEVDLRLEAHDGRTEAETQAHLEQANQRDTVVELLGAQEQNRKLSRCPWAASSRVALRRAALRDDDPLGAVPQKAARLGHRCDVN